MTCLVLARGLTEPLLEHFGPPTPVHLLGLASYQGLGERPTLGGQGSWNCTSHLAQPSVVTPPPSRAGFGAGHARHPSRRCKAPSGGSEPGHRAKSQKNESAAGASRPPSLGHSLVKAAPLAPKSTHSLQCGKVAAQDQDQASVVSFKKDLEEGDLVRTASVA